MVSHHDLQAYLIAIKSILRFDQRFAVTVFDDGTLNEDDRKLLEYHIPNHRFIETSTADAFAEKELGISSRLYRQRKVYLSWRRLIDMQLFRRTPKTINLDTDVLAISNPTALFEWANESSTPFVLGQCNGPETTDKINGILPPERFDNIPTSSEEKNIQTVFLGHLTELCRRMDRPVRFLDGACAGVHGFNDELTLEDIDQLLRHCHDLKIPLNLWGGEQSTVLFLLSTKGAERLPSDTNFNFFPNRMSSLSSAELVHFIGLYRYHRFAYANLARKIIKSL